MVNDEERLIDVLWVEDNVNIHEEYKLEAEDHNLHLYPYTSWESAEKALIEDYDKWSAIILDAKCKFRDSDVDKADRFLTRVQTILFSMYMKKKRIVPYFVLSAGTADMGDLDCLIVKESMTWDASWPKSYYSKNTERGILFDRIREKHSKSHALQIKEVIYKNVFEAIEALKIDRYVSESLLSLLRPLHFQTELDEHYVDRMSRCRTSLEWIFRSMILNKMLPETLLGSEKRNGVNLTWSQFMLEGTRSPINDPTNKLIYESERVLPQVLVSNIKSIIYNVGADIHTEAEQEKWFKDVSTFIRGIGNSPCLIQSMALQLCDLILWYKSYIDSTTEDERRRKWTAVEMIVT